MSSKAEALKPAKMVSNPGEEFAKRSFQGIPGIEITDSGKLWACWYSGGETEGPDNYVVLTSSKDGGESWSDPQIIVNDAKNVRTFDPVLWMDPQKRLWLFWAQCYSKENMNVFDGRSGVWGCFTANPDAETPNWSSPRRIAEGVMMNKPTVLKDGTWALPAALWQDGIRGGYVEDEFKSLIGANMIISKDSGKSFEYLGGVEIEDRTFDEHMFIEKRDGKIWNLVRTHYGIGQSFSEDGGKTWSAGEDSGLGGPDSRFFIRRLDSGRLLLINHKAFDDENNEKVFDRKNLTAYLSDDDGKSWYGEFVLDERRVVSYPDAIQDKDDNIWIIYDRDRHSSGSILLARITEEDIIAGKCVSTDSFLKKLINSIGA